MESISWPVLICTYPSAPSRQTWFTFLMHFLQLLWTPWEEVNFRAMDTTSVTLRSKTDLLYSPNPVDFCFCQGCIWTRAFLQALQIFRLVPCIQEVQRKRQSLIFCVWWAWFWWYISLASLTLVKKASLYFSGCRIGPEMDSGITKRKIPLGTNAQEKWHSLVLKMELMYSAVPSAVKQKWVERKSSASGAESCGTLLQAALRLLGKMGHQVTASQKWLDS